MDKIDLDAIMEQFGLEIGGIRYLAIKASMLEMAHQVLVLASEKYEKFSDELNNGSFEGWGDQEVVGYRTALVTLGAFHNDVMSEVAKLII